MKQQCLACGVEKDASTKEVYPYPDDGFNDEPIDPLFSLECQSAKGWRVVTVCHQCCHRLQPDMWISEQCWQSLNPITPFEKLPKLETT